MTIQTVYGLHDYEPDNVDEINFKINEPITVIETDEKYMDGWWKGRNVEGKVGLFPRNYTTATLTNQNAPSPLSWKYTLPEKWDLNQVNSWLQFKDMSSIATLFMEQEITGDILLQLDMDSLKELGITAYGKRYKLMLAIQSLLSLSEDDGSTLPHSLSIKSNEFNCSSRPSSQESTTPTPTSTSSYQLDTMYQYPRKAPAPPRQRSSFASSVKQSFDLAQRPLSPPNTVSTGISRCNTLSSHHTDSSLRQSFTCNNNKQDYHQSQMSEMTLPAKLPTTTIDSSDAPTQEGWLYKKSDRFNKRWNKRWFVLKNQHLYYFANPSNPRVKGIIYLNGYRIQSDPNLYPGKYCFKAVHEKERTYLFYIDQEEQMRSWVRSLIKATIHRDYHTPVMSSNAINTIPLNQAQQLQPRPPSILLSKNNHNDSSFFLNHHHQPPSSIDQFMSSSKSSPLLLSSSSSKKQQKKTSLTKLEPLYQNEMEDDEDLIDPYHKNVFHPLQKANSINHKNQSQPGLSPRPMINTNTTSTLSQSNSAPFSPLSPTLSMSSSTSNSSSLSSSFIQALPLPPSNESIHECHDHDHYVQWINQHISKEQQPIQSLSTSFRNGDLLIMLLETISGKKVPRSLSSRPHVSSMSMIMLDKIVDAFKFMEQEGISIVDFTIKDVLHGVEDKIILLLDSLEQWERSLKTHKVERDSLIVKPFDNDHPITAAAADSLVY